MGQTGELDNDALRRMLSGKRIAVVGLSDDRSRAAWMIAEYLRAKGREVIPVNPNFETVMGLKCYPSVAAIGEKVDVVNVFRRPEFCPAVARDAVEAGAGGVWLQSGIRSREAKDLVESAGLDYVENRCIMVEMAHMR